MIALKVGTVEVPLGDETVDQLYRISFDEAGDDTPRQRAMTDLNIALELCIRAEQEQANDL